MQIIVAPVEDAWRGVLANGTTDRFAACALGGVVMNDVYPGTSRKRVRCSATRRQGRRELLSGQSRGE